MQNINKMKGNIKVSDLQLYIEDNVRERRRSNGMFISIVSSVIGAMCWDHLKPYLFNYQQKVGDTINIKEININNQGHTKAPETEHEFKGIESTQYAESVDILKFPDELNCEFGEAFALTRKVMGKEGVFEWNGDRFHTYYEEEWDNLSETQQVAISDHAMMLDHVHNMSNLNIESLDFLQDKLVETKVISISSDQNIEIGVFNTSSGLCTKIDFENKGQFDYKVDYNNDKLIGQNNLCDISPEELVEASFVFPIEIKEEIVNGFPYRITTFSDESAEVSIDMNGNGEYIKVASVSEMDSLIFEESVSDYIDSEDIDITGDKYSDNQIFD